MNCNARGTLIVPELAKTLGIAWENEVNEAARCVNTERPLTHSLDLTEEGLAMQATRPCSVADCDRDHAARGYCLPHYKRFRKWGDPLIVRPVTPPVDRFAAKVALTEAGCLEWQGMRNPAGYGIFTIGDQHILAHRWSHEYALGPLGDLLALHRCDNPPCVLPGHLFAGTHADNAADKSDKGRAVAPNAAPAECVNGHEMTPENTYLRRQSDGKYIHRSCRACHRDREALRRKRDRNAS